MVGVGVDDDALARISIVNYHGYPLYDTFVKPLQKVTDYRYHITGIKPAQLKDGKQAPGCQASGNMCAQPSHCTRSSRTCTRF